MNLASKPHEPTTTIVQKLQQQLQAVPGGTVRGRLPTQQ
jgi:hypothetical protein